MPLVHSLLHKNNYTKIALKALLNSRKFKRDLRKIEEILFVFVYQLINLVDDKKHFLFICSHTEEERVI